MSRKNYQPSARTRMANSYNLDYTKLPDHPEYGRIIAVPLRTVYVNLNANFDDVVDYIIKDKHDPLLMRMGVI